MKRYFYYLYIQKIKDQLLLWKLTIFCLIEKLKKEIGERYCISDPEVFIIFCNEITEEDYKNWYS